MIDEDKAVDGVRVAVVDNGVVERWRIFGIIDHLELEAERVEFDINRRIVRFFSSTSTSTSTSVQRTHDFSSFPLSF